jgi:hypothetical protein
MFRPTKARATVCLGAVALAAALLLPRWLADGPGIAWANYCRIRTGMSRAEVEALLGGPPGGYCTERTILIEDPSLPPPPDDGEIWAGDDGGVIVVFDAGGQVTAKGWIKSQYGTKWSLRRFAWRVEEWWRGLWE